MSACYRSADTVADSCYWSSGCFLSALFFIVALLIYLAYRPLQIVEKFIHVTMFLNTLSPKFYVALTGTSSLISGLILIFEWWYFRKYGKSFIEQISLNHIYPLITGADEDNDCDSVDSNSPLTTTQECKVWRNPYSLFRGAEYERFHRATGLDPLTYYDMNLSAQDHQNFFTCEADAGRAEYEIMQLAWRERNPEERIKKTNEALAKNPECATAMILLAEEECSQIVDVCCYVVHSRCTGFVIFFLLVKTSSESSLSEQLLNKLHTAFEYLPFQYVVTTSECSDHFLLGVYPIT
ncbi:Suppression of tumorigenicity 7 isoform a 5 prime [Paragonimus heterotremus]|uniref:Protein ST7 homolog n=1 Tax=Paragonimus heterotremus TaxID=100268 RepID=A0A8J4WDH9_9TREM|nr:Suppression of tumorigenicity 7 isoform a 5 prime [Paragonimus heterotremus]